MKFFHRRAARERDPVRALVEQPRARAGDVACLSHGFVNGDVVHDGAEFIEGREQVRIRVLRAQQADLQVLNVLVLVNNLIMHKVI